MKILKTLSLVLPILVLAMPVASLSMIDSENNTDQIVVLKKEVEKVKFYREIRTSKTLFTTETVKIEDSIEIGKTWYQDENGACSLKDVDLIEMVPVSSGTGVIHLPKTTINVSNVNCPV